MVEAEVVKLLRSEVEEDVNEPQNIFEDSYLYIEAQKILFLIIQLNAKPYLLKNVTNTYRGDFNPTSFYINQSTSWHYPI